MGGSSRPVTQTVKQGPPEFAMPLVQQSLATLQGAKPGLSSQTETALRAIEQRALAGQGLAPEAQRTLEATARGDYLTGQAPGFQGALAAALSRAQREILPQVESSFARAGRLNSGLAQEAQARTIADVIGEQFAQNLAQERQNQLNISTMAPQLANVAYSPLLQVGAAREAAADLPRIQALQALGVIPGLGGTTVQSQPAYRNRTAGALGGALSGAQFGSSFGPIGMGIGALGGGLLGGFA